MVDFQITKKVALWFRFLKFVPLLPNIFDEQLKVYTLFFRPYVFSVMTDFVRLVKEDSRIKSKYHRFGGLEFLLDNKELFHIHGDGLVDFRFTKAIAQDLIKQKLVEEHHVNQQSAWISYQIHNNTDLVFLMELVILSICIRQKNDCSLVMNQLLLRNRPKD